MQFNSKKLQAPMGVGQVSLPAPIVHRRSEAGFVLSLTEVLISVVIVAVVFGSIINGYLAGAKRTEWTGCSLAAQSLGVEFLEQAHAAVWDVSTKPIKNELTNITLIAKSYNSSTKTLTGYTTSIMDIPWKGSNYTIATNFVSIQDIYENNTTNVPVHLQVVRVDTVWPFNGWGKFSVRYYTNSICTYIGPDNRGL